jgi:GNAT superfamily N-acetyltransferase
MPIEAYFFLTGCTVIIQKEVADNATSGAVMFNVKPINNENLGSLDGLATEAKQEGFRFVQRTIDEWVDGANRFSKPGEILWGVFCDGQCIGIGGLNVDPYATDPGIGRVRHLYISKDFRNQGIASGLLKKIIKRSKEFFRTLRVSTHGPGRENPEADKFYEFMGFAKADGEKQTHILIIKDNG